MRIKLVCMATTAEMSHATSCANRLSFILKQQSIAHSLDGQRVQVWTAWRHHLPANSCPQPCLHYSVSWLGLKLLSLSKVEAGWDLKAHVNLPR